MAHHSKGGSISYKYIGPGTVTGTSKYTIRVTHYIDCDNIKVELQSNSTQLGIFVGNTSAYYNNKVYQLPRVADPVPVPTPTLNPCITNAPNVCYYFCYYDLTVDLPDNADGYRLVEQECCRADNITNLANSGNVGSTFLSTIPGTINNVNYTGNSSPQFTENNMAGVICHNSPMSIDLSATDPDGDVLTYSLSYALDGGVRGRNGVNTTPLPGPYTELTYTTGFSGTAPLGSLVSLDPTTGLLSGTAPATVGAYNISFDVTETRNGQIINVTRREILFTVADCSLHAADLKPTYINCDDLNFAFSNQNTASNILSYEWNFGDNSPVSHDVAPVHTYATAGQYLLTLKVVNSSGCNDQVTSVVKAWPGFFPAFSAADGCYTAPFTFSDMTTAKYGMVNSWVWQTDNTTLDNASTVSYSYATPGNKVVSLTVSSDKGCEKTIQKTVMAFDKVKLTIPFSDTLICNGAPLLIDVETEETGVTYQWTPNYNISDPSVLAPIVRPKQTTDYQIVASKNGCQTQETFHVNVVDEVTFLPLKDTSVCIGDTFQIVPQSNGLHYVWLSDQDENSISDPTEKAPKLYPTMTTQYEVTASIDHCTNTQKVNVTAAPYPIVNAGADQTICYGVTAQLEGTTTGKDYYWTTLYQNKRLDNTNLTQSVKPGGDMTYILSAGNNPVCPKWVSDTVNVYVTPLVRLTVSPDTAIKLDEQLPLSVQSNNATVNYEWTPATGLSNNLVANPIAKYTEAGVYHYQIAATTPEGCAGVGFVNVTVYGPASYFYIPNAFSPNGDGKNDQLIPVMVGIKNLKYFRIFNRWGNMVYQTATIGQGWDGYFKGQPAETGAYVYGIEADNVNGKTVKQNGTIVLLR